MVVGNKAKRRLYTVLKQAGKLSGVSFVLFYSMYELVVRANIDYKQRNELFYAIKRYRYKDVYVFYVFEVSGGVNKKIVQSTRKATGSRLYCMQCMFEYIKTAKG